MSLFVQEDGSAAVAECDGCGDTALWNEAVDGWAVFYPPGLSAVMNFCCADCMSAWVLHPNSYQDWRMTKHPTIVDDGEDLPF